MIIECFVISIIIGLLRKGSLRNLAGIPLRHTFLFILPFLLFGVIITLARTNPELRSLIRAGNVIQYVLLLAAIILNVRIREMLVVGVGTFMNFVALAANKGMMPVSMKALQVAGMQDALNGQPIRHALLTPETRLKWLTDVIPVPLGSPYLSEVVSPGDLLVAAAIFILVQRHMRAPSHAKEPATSA